MKSGIYAIINKTNKKMYIGQSKDAQTRWRNHRCMLRKNKHANKHLQNAWNKYGEENFEFKVLLLEDNLERRISLEQEYVNFVGKDCYTIVAGDKPRNDYEGYKKNVFLFNPHKERKVLYFDNLLNVERELKIPARRVNEYITAGRNCIKGYYITEQRNGCALLQNIVKGNSGNTEGIPHYTLHRTTYKILSFPSKRQLCQYFYGKTAHDRLDSVIDNPKRRIKQYLVFSSLSAAKEHAHHLHRKSYSAKLNRYLKDTRWAVTFKDKSELYPTRNAIIRKYSLCPSSLVKLKKGKIKQHKGVITIQNLTGASKTPI